MRLYLHKEAREWALKRWGTLEALEEERKKRDSNKWEESVKRTKGIFSTSSSGGGGAGGGAGQRKRTASSNKPRGT